MRTLGSSFLKIENKGGVFYGGNQAWFPDKFLKDSGCGVISAANLLLYLQKQSRMAETEYMDFATMLWKKYFPVIPGFGMNGLTLMFGLNRYFRKNGLALKAFWGISGKKLLSRIDKMLDEDLPVILSVGPNFPNIWGKRKLNFYTKGKDGSYVFAVKTKAHYVTVTGRDGIYLQISSWGKAYYIDIREYREYVRHYSSSLVSNIICIREKKTI